MWALFIFGDNVEDRMGPGRYLAFYLFSGLAAAGLHIALSPASNIPVVGASGAISGVMAAYLVLYPRARVVTLIPLFIIPWFVQIPALLYIGFWFVSQLFSGVLSLTSSVEAYGGVAWWAHVGGFVMGLLLVKVFEDRQTYSPQWYPDEYRPW
jgi:membrane associated rhomboid family serine protease